MTKKKVGLGKERDAKEVKLLRRMIGEYMPLKDHVKLIADHIDMLTDNFGCLISYPEDEEKFEGVHDKNIVEAIFQEVRSQVR